MHELDECTVWRGITGRMLCNRDIVIIDPFTALQIMVYIIGVKSKVEIKVSRR